MKQTTKSTHKINSLTILTLYATFLMGFIDAYTFLEKGGVFVSAQTGNMIAFSSKLFTGQFAAAAGHIAVFAGFILGAFFGQIAIEKVSGSTRKKCQFMLLTQSIILLVFALFQQYIPDSLMVFLLGALAGLELVLFKKVGITTVNDGIMTGNTKNWATNFYKWIFDKDQVGKQNFLDLSYTLLLFMIGVGAGSLIISVSATLNLWTAFILNTLFFIWISFTKVEMDE